MKINRWWYLGAFLLPCGILTVVYLTPEQWQVQKQESREVQVCVSSTGVHANFIVPVRTAGFDWNQTLSLPDIGTDRQENYHYLSFGWGDREFYRSTPSSSDFKIASAIRALFGSNNPSVMEVQGFETLPTNIEMKCVGVSQANYLRLVQFINQTFEIGTKNQPLRISNGFYGNGGFYAAKGNYSILRHCNAWVVEGLRIAGINTPRWATLPSGILHQLDSSQDILPAANSAGIKLQSKPQF
jgi:uncharacterized protein (TIGR02117 family)